MKCVVFSNNEKKCKELEEILAELSLPVSPYIEEVGHRIEVIEDGTTFEHNALKKVAALSNLKKDIAIADDSGLEIDCLFGRPGVLSARYGGTGLSDSQRCEHVLRQLTTENNRSAQFRCVIAIRLPGEAPITVEGSVKGTISNELAGKSGFGYDPIFIPEGYKKTFAQLGPKIKHKISHRGQALHKAKERIKAHLRNT